MRIKIHPSFGIYLFFIAILSSVSVCLCVVASLFIHELCHYAVCKIIGEELEQLEITPLGGVMTYKRGAASSKGIKGICIHGAGPLGNYVAIWVSSLALTHGIWNTEFLRSMIVANASMLLINLLPALPLDGGQILFCLGYYLFPVERLVCFLSSMGFMVGLAGILLAVYGLAFHELLNCSLIIVSVHMMISSGKCRQLLIAENIYTVIHERIEESKKTKRIVFYQVSPDESLFSLIGCLKQRLSICFVFAENGCMHALHEHDFCQLLLTVPHATVRQACQNALQYQEKVQKNSENPCFTP